MKKMPSEENLGHGKQNSTPQKKIRSRKKTFDLIPQKKKFDIEIKIFGNNFRPDRNCFSGLNFFLGSKFFRGRKTFFAHYIKN